MIKIAVLIGGSGKSLKNLIDLQNESLWKVQCVVAHNSKVPGLKYAHENCISYMFGSWPNRYSYIWSFVESREVDLVIMAGWIKKLIIPDKWMNRVMNIHPSLLPAFGGKGMYGHYVHEAVIQSGAKFSGCTVHYADNEYDSGPIILQRLVPVLDDDTPEILAARVFEQELIAYPEAIRLHIEKRLAVFGRRVKKL